MDVIGTRSSMLILREALYGTTRFDDFARRTKSPLRSWRRGSRNSPISDCSPSSRTGSAGKRTRDEYHLTDSGRDLLPAVFALMQWGNKYLQAEEGGPLRLVERGTGEPVVIGPRTESGRNLDLDDPRDREPNGDWAERTGHLILSR